MKIIVKAHDYSELSFASMSYHLAYHVAELCNRLVFISHHLHFVEPKIVKKEKGEIIVWYCSTNKRLLSLNDLFLYAKFFFKYKPQIVTGHFVGSDITLGFFNFFFFGKVKQLNIN